MPALETLLTDTSFNCQSFFTFNASHYQALSQLTFDTWEDFGLALNRLKTLEVYLFTERMEDPWVEMVHRTVQTMDQYQSLKESENQLKELILILSTHHQLELHERLSLWRKAEFYLNRIWASPHQYVNCLAETINLFFKKWNQLKTPMNQEFKLLGELPTCWLTAFEWENFCCDQKKLCQKIEPFLECLTQEWIERYEQAMNWITGIETYQDVCSNYLNNEYTTHQSFFKSFVGKPLTRHQLLSIVTDAKQPMVITGMTGTGKTLALKTKIDYLIQEKQIQPNQILVLCSNQEQQQTFKDFTSKAEVKTIHQLALDLFLKQPNQTLKLAHPNLLREQIQSVLNRWFSNPSQSESLVYFFEGTLGLKTHWSPNLSLNHFYQEHQSSFLASQGIIDFKSLKLAANRFSKKHISLKNELMKSKEEVLIANFLFLNGIDYVYEKEYDRPYLEQSETFYHPDFYLPQYDCYLEHFGVNASFKTPWLSSDEASKYLKTITWKRELHAHYQTQLIETYSFWFQEGNWETKLTKVLIENGIFPTPLSWESFIKHSLLTVFSPAYPLFEEVYFYLTNMLKHQSGLSYLETLIQQESQKKEATAQLVFFQLVKEVLVQFNQTLLRDQLFDLNQIFSLASQTACVTFPYQYVFCDELEGLTESQLTFIETLREAFHFSLNLYFNPMMSEPSFLTASFLNHESIHHWFHLSFTENFVFSSDDFNQIVTTESIPFYSRSSHQPKQLYFVQEKQSLKESFHLILQQLKKEENCREIYLCGYQLDALLTKGIFFIRKKHPYSVELASNMFKGVQFFFVTPKQLNHHHITHLVIVDSDLFFSNSMGRLFEKMLSKEQTNYRLTKQKHFFQLFYAHAHRTLIFFSNRELVHFPLSQIFPNLRLNELRPNHEQEVNFLNFIH